MALFFFFWVLQARVRNLAIVAVVGGLLLIVIIYRDQSLGWKGLEGILVIMANAWGLVVGLVLLGFGLIEVGIC